MMTNPDSNGIFYLRKDADLIFPLHFRRSFSRGTSHTQSNFSEGSFILSHVHSGSVDVCPTNGDQNLGLLRTSHFSHSGNFQKDRKEVLAIHSPVNLTNMQAKSHNGYW